MSPVTGFSIGPLVLLAGIPLVAAGLAALILGARRGKVLVAVVGLVLLCAAGSAVFLLKMAQARSANRLAAVSVALPRPPRPPKPAEELQADDIPDAQRDADEETAEVSINEEGESKRVLSARSGRHDRVQIGDPEDLEKRRGRSRDRLADHVFPKTGKGKTVLAYAGRIGGVCLLLVLAYLFLDAGKRRQYIWPRRIAVAAAFAAVCVCLWRIGPLM